MSPIGVVIYTLTFLTYAMYFGGYEHKLHISHTAALAVTVVMTAVLLGDIIVERLLARKRVQ